MSCGIKDYFSAFLALTMILGVSHRQVQPAVLHLPNGEVYHQPLVDVPHHRRGH